MTTSTVASPSAAPLSKGQVRAIITGLMVVILLGALDQTIISVSLPDMAADLHGSELLAWVVSGYLIAMAVATPIYGKLGDIYGRRAVLSSAIILFLVTSVACAMAPNMPFLVGARILQGLGGGGLNSVAQATIADVVAPRDRGRYQAYISAAFAVASVSGPVLGGLLTTYLSWRWIFWINLPLGIPALLISRHAMAVLRRPSKQARIDYLGAGLLSSGLSALLLSITFLGQGMPLSNSLTQAMLLITLVALGLYAWHALRTKDPILPLSLFRIRTVTLSCFIQFVAYIQLVSLTVLIPLQLQMLTNAKADDAALLLIPLSLAVPVSAFFAGQLMTRWGTFKYIQLMGAITVPIGLFFLAGLNSHDSFRLVACLALIGSGIGFQLPTSTVAVQNAVPHKDVGVATGVSSFFRPLGSAIGIALLMAYLLMQLQLGASLAGIELSAAEVINTLITSNQENSQSMALVPIAEQAFSRVYYLALFIACFSILFTALEHNDKLGTKLPPTASE